MLEVTEQLRRYGAALEQNMLDEYESPVLQPTPRRRRVAVLAFAAVVAIALVGTARWLGSSDSQAPEVGKGAVSPSGSAPVVVPNVVGETLGRARGTLTRLGFVASPLLDDSVDPAAVVVAQEPGPAQAVPAGSIIGLRTALVGDELCEVMNRVPAAGGDAVQTVSIEGFVEMLRDAQNVAGPELHQAIVELFAHLDGGGTITSAPPRALDRITLHSRGCQTLIDP